jgi:hypothetical protein
MSYQGTRFVRRWKKWTAGVDRSLGQPFRL